MYHEFRKKKLIVLIFKNLNISWRGGCTLKLWLFGQYKFSQELIIQGKTNYSLVLPTNSNEKEGKAAHQLQFYLSKMSKALKVFNEDEYKGDNAIYIGKTNFAKTAEVDSDLLDEDAYFFKQVGNNLVIAGGIENGLMNGVYSLLEFFGLGNTVLMTRCWFPVKMILAFQTMNFIPQGLNIEPPTITMPEIPIMNLGISFPLLTLGECLSTLLSC